MQRVSFQDRDDLLKLSLSDVLLRSLDSLGILVDGCDGSFERCDCSSKPDSGIADSGSDLENVLALAAPGEIVQEPADEGSDYRDCSSVGFLFHLLKEEISWLGDAIQIIVDIVVGYGQNSTIETEPTRDN